MAETGTGSARRSTAAGAAAGRGAPGGTRARETERAAPQPSEHVCPVAFCPIGMALTTVNRANPELLEHLMVATRELFLAVRSALDVRADDLRDRERGGSELERIEIA